MTATEGQIISKVLISVRRALSRTLVHCKGYTLFSNATLKFSHLKIFQFYVQASIFISCLFYFYVQLILINQHYKTYNFGVYFMGRATRANKDLTRVFREAERGGIEKRDY